MAPTTLSVARIAIAYLFFGLIWIVFSDQWLVWLVSDSVLFAQLQTVKGAFFVLMTGLMFFLLARRVVKNHRDLMRRDTLTGLLNRTMARDAVDAQIVQASHQQQSVALFWLNINGFRNINAAFGTAVADQVLIHIAHSLQQSFGHRGVIGRGGADEFVISLQGTYDHAALASAAFELQALTRKAPLPEDSVVLSATVGVALFPQDGPTARALSAAASLAVAQARQQNVGCVFYQQALSTQAEERTQLLKDLAQAVKHETMTLVYQPQFAGCGKYCTGVEVLVRWDCPLRGWVSPAEFIPLAEANGLICAITEFVITQAIKELTELNLLGTLVPRVSINLSAHDFDDVARIDRLVNWLGDHDVVCRHLQFEITETSLMRNLERALTVMNKLRNLGVRFAIDDFGTGYSSLSMLKTLPVTELKVDRSFISELPDDVSDAHLVRTMIVMAHSLNMLVVAEGVETEAQRRFLQDNHCDSLQGFLLARPQPIAELQTSLNRLIQYP